MDSWCFTWQSHSIAPTRGALPNRDAENHSAMAPADPPAPSHPLRWFPEFLELGRRRLKPQARLLGLSLLVGVVSGTGAILFFAACQVVFHYALDVGAG